MFATSKRQIAACVVAAGSIFGTAHAQVTSASDYNHPYGMTQGNENAPVDPSLRDANGNLTVINGQFTSSSMSQETGLQPMGSLGNSSLAATNTVVSGASVTTTGVGFGGGPTGTAAAIGNSLNVVTVGNNNTVVVNSNQVNNGNQTATVNQSGQ